MSHTSDSYYRGKKVVVTGGASGIGEAVVRLMSEAGAQVAILDNDQVRGEKLASEYNGTRFYRCDVSDWGLVQRAVTDLVKDLGGIDVLSCNAGIQRYGDIETTSVDGWDEVLNVNLKSMFLCCKACVPHLKEAKGSIVLMGSVQGYATQKNVLAYTTSKHAIIGFLRAMALDLASSGVRVNGVAPGSVNTPMLRNAVEQDPNPQKLWKTLDSMHPLGRVAQPEEIARVVAFLAGDQSTFVTGSMLLADGGLLLPITGSPASDD